jgi:hypothetical protein
LSKSFLCLKVVANVVIDFDTDTTSLDNLADPIAPLGGLYIRKKERSGCYLLLHYTIRSS